MLLLADCLILVRQKVRLGFLNVRFVGTIAAFNITDRISRLGFSLSLTCGM
jgi:hypothetical protein